MLKPSSFPMIGRWIAVCLSASSIMMSAAHATTVQFQTSLGDFEVNLYDNATPQTVANFLRYVNTGAYTDTMIHRSVATFVLQGGGLTFVEQGPPEYIATNDPVINEPVYSNRRGTIAMAKVASDPNSATSQWFINLSNNSANLDVTNGGFTVFGEVTGQGMSIVDAIVALPTFDLGSSFTHLPLMDYTQEQFEQYYLQSNDTEYQAVNEDNIVFVRNIMVLDASPDTASTLTPIENTLIDANDTPSDPPPTNTDNDSGGGSLYWANLLLLLSLPVIRRRTGK
ncbi:peptidylprolyl isomerase [Teredinibacter purpureus]|uniref:peptidylprolyl isomerase n=1 Tax=Teredinibacter purpureus TaxID=2731756 RepID=UPI000B1A29CB|nr:peptidylprolyl isomerase [Teredinibacter purpureus]